MNGIDYNFVIKQYNKNKYCRLCNYTGYKIVIHIDEYSEILQTMKCSCNKD